MNYHIDNRFIYTYMDRIEYICDDIDMLHFKKIRKMECKYVLDIHLENKRDITNNEKIILCRNAIRELESKSILRFLKRKKFYSKRLIIGKKYRLVDLEQCKCIIIEINILIDCLQKKIRYIQKKEEIIKILHKKFGLFRFSDIINLTKIIISYL